MLIGKLRDIEGPGGPKPRDSEDDDERSSHGYRGGGGIYLKSRSIKINIVIGREGAKLPGVSKHMVVVRYFCLPFARKGKDHLPVPWILWV